MKYYVLEGKHLVPFKDLEHLVPAHHAFLARGYADGHFLFSGPQVPPHGGFLVARAPSREALDEILSGEPFVREGKMQFTRVTEFEAAQCQEFAQAWFGK